MLFACMVPAMLGCGSGTSVEQEIWFNVNFQTNGGTAVSSIKVKAEGKLTPVQSRKNGCDLDGWYRESNFRNRWNFAADKVAGDMTLYAKWRAGREIAETVYVWDSAGKSLDQILLAQAIQGITSREKAQVYITWTFDEGVSWNVWLKELKDKHGFETVVVTDVWELADMFKDNIKGYVAYPAAGNETMNYAATLAGVLDALPVTPRLRPAAESRGLEQLDDAQGYTIEQIISKYGSRLNRKMFLNQHPEVFPLRDYGIKHRSLIVCPVEQAELQPVYDFMEPFSVLFGWDLAGGEVGGVAAGSANQVATIPSDRVLNLSVFEEVSASVHKQKEPIDKDLKAQAGKHYVSFVYTDLDNLSVCLGQWPLDTKTFAYPNKDIPFGYCMTAALPDFAPVGLDYLYRTASPADNFISAFGYGYIYMSRFTEDNLNVFGALTADYMRRSDMQTVVLIDGDVEQTAAAWEAFSKHDQITGIMYSRGSASIEGKGYVEWSNGKPIVSFREALWSTEGSQNRDIYRMAYRLSQYGKDFKSIGGYSLVVVHPWSHDYESVVKMAEWFKENDPDVIIVTPDTLMRLVAENLPQERAEPDRSPGGNWVYPPEVIALY